MGISQGTKFNMLSTDEKLVVVKDHYENNLSFNELKDKYGVSYSAVRKWCLDYDAKGVEALVSKTGKQNQARTWERSNSLDPKDREIARLRKELKAAEMRETIAKKLNEAMAELQKELSSKK